MTSPYICWRCLRTRIASGPTLHLRQHSTPFTPRAVASSRKHNLHSTSQHLQDNPSNALTSSPDLATYFDRAPRSHQLESHQQLSKEAEGLSENELAEEHAASNETRPLRPGKAEWKGDEKVPISAKSWRMQVVDKEMKSLVTKDRTPLEVWHRLMSTNAFQSRALPEALEITLRRSPELKRAFRLFIHESIYESSPLFPSLDQVLTTFLNRGLFRYQLLWYVLNEMRPQLSVIVFGSSNSSSQEGKDERAIRALSAIMDAWRLTIQPAYPLKPTSANETPKSWTGLPSEEETEHTLKTYGDYFERFKRLFAGCVDSQLETAVASDSAWVYLCFEHLRKRGSTPDSLVEEWRPWTELMGKLLAPAQLLHTNYLRRILGKASSVVNQGLISSAIQQSRENRQPQDEPSQQDESTLQLPQPPAADGHSHLGAAAYRSRLIYAAKQDERHVLNIWYEFVHSVNHECTQDYISSVLAEFMWHFARSRQLDRAWKVWQYLRKSEIQPIAAHWTAMVEASKATGNVASVQAVWQLMLQAKGDPPNQAWTAYINALFKLKDESSALKAVSDLDKQWWTQREQQTIISNSMAPSMIPINTAISGLLARHHPEPIDALLKLAGQHGLNPGTDTYNIFLRDAAEDQDVAKMLKIFGEMKKARCEPDVITFTLLIECLLRHPDSPLHSSTLKEQEEAVDQIFADLAAAGLEPSAHTYTTLLRSLLDNENVQLSAVQAILRRMSQQGIRDNSYAYTALVGHHFTRNPPDIAAIERLQQCITNDNITLDAEFYNRLARGFAEAGEYDHALSALRRLTTRGKLHLRTATALLTLFVREADSENAKELVRKVQRETIGPSMIKRDRREMPRWTELVSELQAGGVVDRQPEPASIVRKIY